MPQEEDKRLAAESVALIAQECDSQTFLRSWSAWGALLTSMVQMDSSAVIRAAAWAAMSHVTARRDCIAGHIQSCACSVPLYIPQKDCMLVKLALGALYRLAAALEVPGIRRDGSALVSKLAGVLVTTIQDEGGAGACFPAASA